MKKPGSARGAFTVLEVLVASAILVVVLFIAYQLLSRVFSPSSTSAASLNAASLLRSDVRLAYQKLIDRIEDSIEIVTPGPGQSSTELVFQDLLNHRIALQVTPEQELRSFRVESGALRTEAPVDGAPVEGGAPLTRPVRIPRCRRVRFEVLSPTLVTTYLVVSDGHQEGTLVATTRLRNAKLADD